MRIFLICCFFVFVFAVPSNLSKNASISSGKLEKSASNMQIKLPQGVNKTGSVQHYEVIEKPDGSLEAIRLNEFRSSEIRDASLQCTGLANGLYEDPLSPCVSRFYRCENGAAAQLFCISGLVFSRKLLDCVDPRKVVECRAPVKLVEPFRCDKQPDGNYENPEDPCREFFFSCSGGITFIRLCNPTTLRYDALTDQCLSPAFVKSCGGIPQLLDVPAVVAVSSAPGASVASEFDCETRRDGNYRNPNAKCSSVYFACVGGTAQVRFCSAANTKYDRFTDTCHSPELVPDCGGEFALPTKKTAKTTSSVKLPANIPAPKSVNCTGLKYLRVQDPNQPCSRRFFICIDGIAHPEMCDEPKRFDPVWETCIPVEYVRVCGGVPGATTTASSLKNLPHVALVEVEIAADFCFHRPDRNYALTAGLCDRFFVACAGGKAIAWECPEETAYDEKSDRCEFPTFVAACGGIPTTTPSFRFDAADFDCKADGDFGLGCNESFVTCSNGRPFPKKCANSQTRFDEVSGKCLFPKYVEACGGARSTTEIPKSTKPVYLFDCHRKPQGNYPDPRQSCSHSFFICFGDKFGVERDCVGNTYFDPELDQCLYHNEVPACIGGPRPDSTTAAATISRPSTAIPEPPIVVNFDCSTKNPGQYPNFEAKNCSNTFYTCLPDGQAKVHQCPGETFYDQELNQCLFYEQVPECTGKPRPVVKTTNQTVYVDPSIFDCSGESAGNYPPPGVECAKYFYQCAHGKTFKFDCPANLRYYAGQDACLAPFQVPGCPGYIPDKFCAEKINGFYANPADCNKFFFCVNGTDYSINCPPGEVFSRERFRCRPIKEVDEPCGTRQPVLEDVSCKNRQNGMKFDSHDCRKYYVCEDGSLSALDCGEGMAFAKQKRECDLAIKVTECSPPADTGMARFCEGRTDGLFSFPDNCHLSVICAEGRPFVFACMVPGKPDFDPILKQCVKNVKGCGEN